MQLDEGIPEAQTRDRTATHIGWTQNSTHWTRRIAGNSGYHSHAENRTVLPNDNDSEQIDVTVTGGGLAGMATSIHLVRAGLRVLCIEADIADTQPVGESLDWSAPDLLAAFGLSMDRLISEGIATWKRHVTLRLADGSTTHYVPGEWLGQPPFNLELRTLHVDRVQLNAAIRKIAIADGVRFLHDRVTRIETQGRAVTSVITEQGARIASRWFIDASGSAARLLPRTFNLPASDYGPHKVAIWSYFTVSESIEGTTLHAEGSCPAYMDWVWEIPIHANTISIGYVSTGEAIKALRATGHTTESIFRTQLDRFPRFRDLIQSSPSSLRALPPTAAASTVTSSDQTGSSLEKPPPWSTP